MFSTVRQSRILIFLLCAGIAVSLAQATLLQGAASHDPSGIPSRSMAGHPEKAPTLEKQQLSCANARPTFQGCVALATMRAFDAPIEQAELTVLDKSHQPQTELLQARYGRAPPSALFQ
jgi:hypothetical protein